MKKHSAIVLMAVGLLSLSSLGTGTVKAQETDRFASSRTLRCVQQDGDRYQPGIRADCELPKPWVTDKFYLWRLKERPKETGHKAVPNQDKDGDLVTATSGQWFGGRWIPYRDPYDHTYPPKGLLGRCLLDNVSGCSERNERSVVLLPTYLEDLRGMSDEELLSKMKGATRQGSLGTEIVNYDEYWAARNLLEERGRKISATGVVEVRGPGSTNDQHSRLQAPQDGHDRLTGDPGAGQSQQQALAGDSGSSVVGGMSDEDYERWLKERDPILNNWPGGAEWLRMHGADGPNGLNSPAWQGGPGVPAAYGGRAIARNQRGPDGEPLPGAMVATGDYTPTPEGMAAAEAEVNKECAILEHDARVCDAAGWTDLARRRRMWIWILRNRGWGAYGNARDLESRFGQYALLSMFNGFGNLAVGWEGFSGGLTPPTPPKLSGGGAPTAGSGSGAGKSGSGSPSNGSGDGPTAVGQGSGVAPVLQAGADPLIEALAREYKLNQAAIDLLHHFRALGLGPSVLRMLARQYQGKPMFTR